MNIPDLDLSILKTITTNKKHAIDFATDCETKLFSTDVWNFANLVVSYVKNFKEVPTLRVLTERLAKGNNASLIDYCNSLWSKIDAHKYDDKEYKFDLDKLKTRYSEKQFSDLKELFNKNDPSKTDIEKSLQEVERKIQNIKSLRRTKAYERRTLKNHIPLFRDKFNEKLQNPLFDQGLMTGYSYLDSATGGLRPGELLLIGGESGGGKSMLLMNIALQMWLQENTVDMKDNFKPGINVLYFSLEMPYEPCYNRVLSRLSGVPSKSIRQPVTKDGKRKVSKEEAAKIKTVLQFTDNYPNQFEIIDIPRGATAEQVELLFEEAKTEFDPQVIVIDYLGIMDDESQDDDWLKLGKIAGKIHELGRAQGLVVLSAVQLNRSKGGSKDSEEKIGMHRIGRSALIMTHANIGIQIETRPNEKQFPDMFYHLIKNRDGEQGKGKLIKNLACGTLLDDPIKEEESTDYEFTDLDDISEKIEYLDI